MVYKTVGQLIDELKIRLGMLVQGPVSSNIRPILVSFIQSAHDIIYADLYPNGQKKVCELRLQTWERIYDYHNDDEDEDIDPGFVESIWVINKPIPPTVNDDTPEQGMVITIPAPPVSYDAKRLIQGIDEALRSDATTGEPVYYDTHNKQLEIWPVPDSSDYVLRINYLKSAPQLTQDSHRCVVPDTLVFMLALGNAKSHYRHPDSGLYFDQYKKLMGLEKAKQHENKRYFVHQPKKDKQQFVTGSNGNYRLMVE